MRYTFLHIAVGLGLAVLFGLAAFATEVGAGEPAPEDEDYQKIADGEEWKWVPERASARDSAKNFKGDFQAEVVEKDTDGRKSATVKFAKGDDVVFTIDGHAETVFAGRDNVVYYADFSQNATGCSVIAYDLKAKKQRGRPASKGWDRSSISSTGIRWPWILKTMRSKFSAMKRLANTSSTWTSRAARRSDTKCSRNQEGRTNEPRRVGLGLYCRSPSRIGDSFNQRSPRSATAPNLSEPHYQPNH
jgi:hypothetical protein